MKDAVLAASSQWTPSSAALHSPTIEIVATAAAAPLAAQVAAHLDLPVRHVSTRVFSNEQFEVRLDPPAGTRTDVLLFQSFPDRVHDRLIELLMAADLVKAAGAQRITAVLPYMPYSRSDRPACSGAPVTARLLARLLEEAGIERLVTVELHSSQLCGFFCGPVVEIDMTAAFARHFGRLGLLGQVAAVVSPDLGGAKRAERLAMALGASLAVMRKTRRSGMKESFEVLGDVGGRQVIICDDEINSGETLLSASRTLRAAGAMAVHAAASHALLTPDAPLRLSAVLNGLVVTDSVPCTWQAGERLDVLPVAPDIVRILSSMYVPASDENRASPG